MSESFQKISVYTKDIPLKKICFLLILVTFVGFALTYSILTPTHEGPDEDAHYRYSIWLFNPELRPNTTHSIYTDIGQPLYYVVNSIFFNILDPDDEYVGGLHVTYEYPRTDVNRFQHGPEEIFPYSDIALTVHTLRLLSIAFGVITLIFVYKIAQLVFHNHNWLPLYTTAFVSLIPMFLSINAVLNSDVLLWTLFTIALFFLLKFVNEPNRIRFVILTAVFATLAISTKSNGLVFIPIFLSVIAYLFISKQIRIQSLVKNIFLYGIFSVISISWLWVFRVLRNIDYNNVSIMDILYTAFGFRLVYGLTSIVPPGILRPSDGAEFLFSRITDLEFLHTRFVEYVGGGFWWNTIWLPKIYYVIIDIFLVISIVGLAIFLIRRQDIMTKLNMKKNHLFILTLSILLPLGYMYINFLQTEIGIARYYFLIISMLGIVIPLGWYTFVYNKKKLQFLMFFPLVFLIFLNVQVLIVMGEEQKITTFRDTDLDSIPNDLDTKPNEFSNDFNDFSYGKNNFGVINRSILDTYDRYALTLYLESISDVEKQVYAIVKLHSGLTKHGIFMSYNYTIYEPENVYRILDKLVDEKKIFTDGISYYWGPKLELIPDLEQSAIQIKFVVRDYVSKPIEVSLCEKTNIWMAMGDKIVFSCINNEPNILEHSILLHDLPFGLKEGDLIQGETRGEVYILQDKTKRHIANPEVFTLHGFTIDMIKQVPNDVVDKIFEGFPIFN